MYITQKCPDTILLCPRSSLFLLYATAAWTDRERERTASRLQLPASQPLAPSATTANCKLSYRSDGSPELARGVEDLELLQPGTEVVCGEVTSRGGEPGVLAGLRSGDSPRGVHG